MLAARGEQPQLRPVLLSCLGATVYVSRPTAATEIRAQAMMMVGGRLNTDRLPESRAWRIAQCLRDQDGRRIIGEEQTDVLLSLSKEEFEELDSALETPASVEGALGNSEATRS
jgi:hypothetical protein